VIIPRPDLRIDEIAIPKIVADKLLEGLPADREQLVLVNRNPSLHRQGLIAMRPVISHDENVFGLPLGVLGALGADFDGDQASVVALETDAALEEAYDMLPGAINMRAARFRSHAPLFPLQRELSSPAQEQQLAADAIATQSEWVTAHYCLIQELLESLEPKDSARTTFAIPPEPSESAWLSQAREEMWDGVLRKVRKKGTVGGLLRRELYRRPYTDADQFFTSVDALQTVTQPLTQAELSVKKGEMTRSYRSRPFFDNPASRRDEIAQIDSAINASALIHSLGQPAEPEGLLEALSNTSIDAFVTSVESSSVTNVMDPRISWFVA
jgi:hypothetical protein